MPQDSKIRILIVGAGKAGELIQQDIEADKESPFQIVGFVDDDPEKYDQKIADTRVLGSVADLHEVVEQNHVEEIFIAIPSERGKVIRHIIENTIGLKVVYKILPRLSEVLLQDFKEDYLKFVRRVKAEDLLGGEILKADQHEITEYAKGQTILITGAAGSIGSELSRQLAAHEAEKIIFYDWWENGMFDLRNQLVESNPEGSFEFIIGDIKD